MDEDSVSESESTPVSLRWMGIEVVWRVWAGTVITLFYDML